MVGFEDAFSKHYSATMGTSSKLVRLMLSTAAMNFKRIMNL
jgi:hypothetical protein